MTWTKLDPGAHVAMWCASEGCLGIPFHRLEVDGVTSNYCTNCRADIETLPGRLAAARELLSSLT